MNQARLFTTGIGSRERHTVKTCPKCGSSDILFKHGNEGKFYARCGKCGWFGSKSSLEERDENRYERAR